MFQGVQIKSLAAEIGELLVLGWEPSKPHRATQNDETKKWAKNQTWSFRSFVFAKEKNFRLQDFAVLWRGDDLLPPHQKILHPKHFFFHFSCGMASNNVFASALRFATPSSQICFLCPNCCQVLVKNVVISCLFQRGASLSRGAHRRFVNLSPFFFFFPSVFFRSAPLTLLKWRIVLVVSFWYPWNQNIESQSARNCWLFPLRRKTLHCFNICLLAVMIWRWGIGVSLGRLCVVRTELLPLAVPLIILLPYFAPISLGVLNLLLVILMRTLIRLRLASLFLFSFSSFCISLCAFQ